VIGHKFDMRAELAKIYDELETVVEVRNGRAWRNFRAMLEEWVFALDESIMDLSNKRDKNEIEILYKTAMRNSYIKLLHAIETTVVRLPDLEAKKQEYEKILDKAPKG